MRRDVGLLVAGGLVVVLALAFFVSPLASSSPDGLNKVANEQGLDETVESHAFEDGPVAGYSVRGIEDERVSRGLAGAIGVLLTFGIGTVVFALIRLKRGKHSSDTAPAESGR